jgi:hypothetical protein
VWTDFWLSIVGAGCGLTGVGAGEEQAQKVVVSEASTFETNFYRLPFTSLSLVRRIGPSPSHPP